MNNKLNIIEAKQKFIERGFIPLFDEYKNSTDKLPVKTNDGYKFVISIHKLKYLQKPHLFSISNPYTIENIRLWCQLNQKLFKLISEEFVGVTDKLQ
jgi:hypothetical protein